MGNGRDVLAGGEPQVELRKRDRMKATARRYVRVPLAVRTSDLPKRAASAAVHPVLPPPLLDEIDPVDKTVDRNFLCEHCIPGVLGYVFVVF